MAKIHYDELTVGVPSKASSVNYENADGTKESVQSKISKIENDVGKSKQDIEGSQGRNLIPYPYYEGTSKVHNGVTFTVNKDGSVTANGTATNGDATFTLARRHPDSLNDLIIPNGIYTVSGCPDGGSNGTYWVQVTRTHNNSADLLTKEYGQGATFEADGDDYSDDSVNLGFQTVIKKGFTVNDLVFKPMLEEGTVAHAYEPTIESNVTLKQNIADLRVVRSKKITVTNVPCNTAWGGTYISASKSYDISDLPIAQAKSVQVAWLGEVTSFMTVEAISNVLTVVFLRGTQASAISGTIFIDCIM